MPDLIQKYREEGQDMFAKLLSGEISTRDYKVYLLRRTWKKFKDFLGGRRGG